MVCHDIPRVTYLSVDPVTSTVGASQVLAYVERLAERGVRVDLHSFEHHVDEMIAADLARWGVVWTPHVFGGNGARAGLGRVARLARSIRGAELVHARSDMAAAAAMWSGAECWVWDVRSFWADQKVATGVFSARSPQARVFRRIERRAASRARHVVALTPSAIDELERRYDGMEESAGEETQRQIERYILLTTIDSLWVQHLTAMDEMRQGIGLRAYAQTDPLVAYKREAHDMWGQLLENIRSMVVRQIFHARPVATPRLRAKAVAPVIVQESGPGEESAAGGVGSDGGAATATAPAATRQRTVKKVGRNDACPCGSGKKYKRCHGAAA